MDTYEKFNNYSKETQQEIIDFVRMLVSSIEIFAENDSQVVHLNDFGKGDFDRQKIIAIISKINELLGDLMTKISCPTKGWGPPNNRRWRLDLSIEYKQNTLSILKSFLKTLNKNDLSDLASNKQITTKYFDGEKIEIIEILKDFTENGRIKVYINKNYSKELDFSRGKLWSMMYNLAKDKNIDFNKYFLDYFNSNLNNPLYRTYNLKLAKILKVEGGIIVKNIKKIDLITKKKITQNI